MTSPLVDGARASSCVNRSSQPEVPQRKPYDVSYKVRSVPEILQMQRKEVEKVQTLLEVPVCAA